MTEKYVETLRLMTHAWQCDHLGHVNLSFYMGWFGDAVMSTAALYGWPREQMMAEQGGIAAVKAEVEYQAELLAGEMVRMESAVESIGERKIVFRHRLIRVGDGKQVTAARMTAVCIDLVKRRSRPFPQSFVASICEAFDIAPDSPKEVAA